MSTVLALPGPARTGGVTVYAVANRIIAYGRVLIGPDQPAMTARRINLLAYIAYGTYAHGHGSPLCAPAPQAWAAGPAFAELVYALHAYGDAPVRAEIRGPAGIPTLPPGAARALVDRVCLEEDERTDAALLTRIAGQRAWRHTLAERGAGAQIPVDRIRRDFVLAG